VNVNEFVKVQNSEKRVFML